MDVILEGRRNRLTTKILVGAGGRCIFGDKTLRFHELRRRLTMQVAAAQKVMAQARAGRFCHVEAGFCPEPRAFCHFAGCFVHLSAYKGSHSAA
jgi:hypothetical protein